MNGKNILKFTGKTVEQCKEICSAMSNCVAFEFGVAYGGAEANINLGTVNLKAAHLDPAAMDPNGT